MISICRCALLRVTTLFAFFLYFYATSLLAQLNPSSVFFGYGESDRVVVKVYFSSDHVARQIAKTYEPMESDYAKGYLVLSEDVEELLRLEALTDNLNITIEIDVEATEHEQNGLANSARSASSSVLSDQAEALNFIGIPGFSCYRTVEEVFLTAENIVANYPTLATWIDIGNTWEKDNGFGGYDMRALKLTNSAIPGPKPKLTIFSSIHAREYTPQELVTRFAEMLVDQYDIDPDITWMLDHNEVHMILVGNPDGRKRAEAGLSWRKTTNQNYCGASSNSRGVDLNRNFSFNWGCCNGSSSDQCSLTYRGPFASSEPELRALENYLINQYADNRGTNLNDAAPADTQGLFLDMHSSGRLVLWPWGFTSNPAPNGIALQTLGRKLAYFNGHSPEQFIGLYPADGTTTAFAYGELGLPAYTIELGTQFFESCSYFENTLVPDNMPALRYAIKATRAPYLAPAGPEPINVSVTPDATSIPAGTLVTLTAQMNDTRFNNSNGTEPTETIVQAEYYFDIPPWDPTAGTASATLSAVDGSFDSRAENVSAIIDTTGLDDGRYTLYVRGQDSVGNWGVVSAVFLNIDSSVMPVSVYSDDFETDQGWITNPNGTDLATTGQWEIGDPEDTNSSGPKQLGTAVSGTNTLVTARLAGSSVGTNDIDSGETSVWSPLITLSPDLVSATLKFSYYLAHTSNSSADDYLRVSIIGEGSTLLFEERGAAEDDDGVWESIEIPIDGFIGQDVRILLAASDAANGSIVEAAIDDLSIVGLIESSTVNSPPIVDAGVDQTIIYPSVLTLDGTVSDDGLPNPPASISSVWEVVSAPGSVTFASNGSVDTSAEYSTPGLYIFRLTANDGELSQSDDVSINILVNTAPSVNAGTDQTITLPDSANLSAVVSDDGLPVSPGSVAVSWEMQSGPGVVTFDDSSLISATATFSVEGTYELLLTATDGAITASDTVTVTVLPAPPNMAPTIANPGDLSHQAGESVSVNLIATDPDVGDTLTYSAINLPASLSLDDSTGAISGLVNLGATGAYNVTVSVTDGELSHSVNFVWTITPAPTFYEAIVLGTSGGTTNTGNFVLGYRFTSNTDIRVTDLGMVDQNANQQLDNPANSTVVGLWTSTGTLLRQVTLTGNPAITNETFYAPITPIELTPGQYVVAVTHFAGGEPYRYSGNPFQSSAEVQLDTGLWGSGNSLIFPTNSNASIYEPGFLGVNFRYELVQPNQAPIVDHPGNQNNIENETISLSIAASDPDDSGTLSYGAINLPDGLSIDSATGEINGTLSFLSAGVYSVTISVTDGIDTVNVTFNWNVANTNVAPVMSNPGNQVDSEGDNISLNLSASDLDVSDILTYNAINLPAGLSINSVSGEITGVLTYDSTGSYSVTVAVSDGTLSDSAAFVWTVNNTNRPPVISTPGNQVSAESESISLSIDAVDNDSESTLSYVASNLPDGLLINSSTGVITGVLSFQSAGSYTTTITVSDGIDSSNTTFSWTVSNTNRPPNIDLQGDQINAEGDNVSVTITVEDADGDSPLVFSAYELPAGLDINATSGEITGLLGFDSAGRYTVIIEVSDGFDTSSITFNWTINETNQVPEIVPFLDLSHSAGDMINLIVDASDNDLDSLAFSATGLPNGLSIDNQTGVISGIPTIPASYLVTTSVTDSQDTDEESFTWFITPAGTSTIVNPIADSYIRDGIYAEQNFGSSDQLIAKQGSANYDRAAYLKFDLTSFSTISKATFRIYGLNLSDSIGQVSVFGLDDDSWTEQTINAVNAPVTSNLALVSDAVESQPGYYEFDISAFAEAQRNGDGVVSLRLESTLNNAYFSFNSREGNNPPELIIYE